MKKINWKYELKSTANTFAAVFVGTLLASPIINHFLGLNLPTIHDMKDVYPVIIETIYRSIWLTILTKLGLDHRQSITVNETGSK